MTFRYLDPTFRTSVSTDIFQLMHEVDLTRAVVCNNATQHSNEVCAGNVEGNGSSLPYTTLTGSHPLDIMTRVIFGHYNPYLGMQNMTS